MQYKGTVHTVTYGHMSHGDEISASFSEAVDKALALYGQADDQTKQDFRMVWCKDWIRLDDWTTNTEKLSSSRILGGLKMAEVVGHLSTECQQSPMKPPEIRFSTIHYQGHEKSIDP